MTPRPNDGAQLDLLEREFALVHELDCINFEWDFEHVRESYERAKAIRAELVTLTEWPSLAEVFGSARLGWAALGRMGSVDVYTVEQLVTWPASALSGVSQLGPAILEHIEDALAVYGLSLLEDE